MGVLKAVPSPLRSPFPSGPSYTCLSIDFYLLSYPPMSPHKVGEKARSHPPGVLSSSLILALVWRTQWLGQGPWELDTLATQDMNGQSNPGVDGEGGFPVTGGILMLPFFTFPELHPLQLENEF